MSNYSKAANDRFYKNNPHYTSKNKKLHADPIFNLKVSEEEKYKNNSQWFKEYAEYIVPAYNSSIEDYEELKMCYEIYNDDLTRFKDKLDHFCDPLGENVGQIEEEIQPYPKLHNKVNVLKGEFIKRGNDHKIVLLSAKVIKDKDDRLLSAIKESVEEKVMLEIEKVQQQLEGMGEQEIEKYIQELRTQNEPEDILQKNFQSEQEIFYSKALKYCYYDQQIKAKQLETLEDSQVSDRCYIYSGWRHGKPYVEVRNTLFTGFHKDPNEKYVQKSDRIWYKKPITISEVYNTYGHLLTEEEISNLGVHTYSNNYKIDKRHALGGTPVFDQTNEEMWNNIDGSTNGKKDSKEVGMHQGKSDTSYYNNERTVWETHIEFVAFRELIFLSYKNEFNNDITLLVSKDFTIPKIAVKEKFINKWGQQSIKHTWFEENSGTEYTAETLFIPRKYEVIRLGSDVYPIMREVPNQHTNIENPFSNFTLSTFGMIFTARNAKSRSSIQRAIPSYFQFLYVKHIMNRELAKYQGYISAVDTDQIPVALGEDMDGELIKDPIAVWTLYRKKLGIDFYSGSQTSTGGLPPATRSPGSGGYILGTAQEIFTLQQLLQYIDVEIGMAMGISPQREAQFSSSSNVSDNQQAITQSHHITEPYFFELEQLWSQTLLDYLKNFRTYCKQLMTKSNNNPLFHYILPDGSEELLEVTDTMLEPIDLGIYVANGGSGAEYNRMMMQLSHSFAQNAGEGVDVVSNIIKQITNGASPEETHKLLMVEQDKQAKRRQQQEETKLRVQEEYIAREKEFREDVQSHEIEKINLKGEWDIKKQIIASSGFGADIDDNGVPDALDTARFVHQQAIDVKKLDLEEKKLQQNNKKLDQDKALKEKQLKQAKKSKT